MADGRAAEKTESLISVEPVIIIGGGPAGLLLSYLLPSSLLIEKNSQCGLKLLISGNGACNVTHDEESGDFVRHYYEKKSFVSPSIYSFSPERIREFFSSLGVETYVRPDGRVFPVSMKSSSIRDSLMRRDADILYGTSVLSIKEENTSFILETTSGIFQARILVIATGGRSYPQTGSTGDGWRFSKDLGHRIAPPHPALAPLKTEPCFPSLEGVTLEGVTLREGKTQFTGPLLFTKNGISGPAVLNISRCIKEKTKLTVRYVTSFNAGDIKKENGKGSMINTVHRMTGLPLSFLSCLLGDMKGLNNASITKAEMMEIEKRLLSSTLEASIDGGERKAMVTSGGVDTAEVDKKTMESKIVPNLYFAGEILDVDGECGGYNISFALASAYLAAEDIKRKISLSDSRS